MSASPTNERAKLVPVAAKLRKPKPKSQRRWTTDEVHGWRRFCNRQQLLPPSNRPVSAVRARCGRMVTPPGEYPSAIRHAVSMVVLRHAEKITFRHEDRKRDWVFAVTEVAFGELVDPARLALDFDLANEAVIEARKALAAHG